VFDTMPGITTFEITTALANAWFAQQNADFAVFEVGLGGRLDATNVLYPNVCAITSISYDHTQLLGKTLPEIAEEKAGIIKAGAPVVSAPQDDSALERIAAIARERGARLRVVGRDWLFSRDSFSHASQSFHMQPSPELADEIRQWPPTHFIIPLLGPHQIDNAAVAVAVSEELCEQGFEISLDAIQQGLANVIWPGRFEVFADSGKTIILDCAHNRDSTAKLVATLREQYNGVKPVLIFGASDDKDVSGMLTELTPQVSQVIIAKADHPRASDPDRLVAMTEAVAAECGVALSVNVAHTVSDALEAARGGKDDFILVTGSIFLVADIRALLKPTLTD
jgi:dihydrofolate synthase/folylpolyglutamate synthase